MELPSGYCGALNDTRYTRYLVVDKMNDRVDIDTYLVQFLYRALVHRRRIHTSMVSEWNM